MKKVMDFLNMFLTLRPVRQVVGILIVGLFVEATVIIWLGKRDMEREIKWDKYREKTEQKIFDLERERTQASIEWYRERGKLQDEKDKQQNERQRQIDSSIRRSNDLLSNFKK